MAKLRSLLVLSILPLFAALAAEIPAGTTLSLRQQVPVGTRFSKVGDPVSAVLLSPVVEHERTILPAGSELDGTVSMVRKFGFGVKHETATLALNFHSIRLADGTTVSIDARMKHLETAKEWVDSDGRIRGIRSATNVSSSLALAAWRLIVIAPGVGASVWATKLLFAPAPDTEITLARGTEYRLELTRPLEIEDTDFTYAGLPARLLSRETKTEARAVMDALPSQRARRLSGEQGDLVNLVVIGSAGSVSRAFQAAGWTTSDRKAAGSVLRTYFSIILRRGYSNAPMATMTLDGKRSDGEFEKSLNTFSKRHHLRIWLRPQEAQDESVWVAAATEDTGIKFSVHAHNFTHTIDGNVDTERTKVVDDLLYGGCVSEVGFIERHNLPAHLDNGTGTTVTTDGRVAVLRITECGDRVMPGVGIAERTNVFRVLGGAIRSELIRSNIISLAYNDLRLTSATRRFLFGKPPHDDTGATLTRQQVAWLVEKEPPMGEPEPSIVPEE